MTLGQVRKSLEGALPGPVALPRFVFARQRVCYRTRDSDPSAYPQTTVSADCSGFYQA
jgi:hypothetical protein